MNTVEEKLASWGASLPATIEVAGLLARNPVVYKWKSPFRSVALREGLFWRVHDLMMQSHALFEDGHGLGARILLRSGFETAALLIHLNQITQMVIEGKLPFEDFNRKTSQLLLGSRRTTSSIQSINIVTIIEKVEKNYPGLTEIYAGLSEVAHPNYEGVIYGYPRIIRCDYATKFENRWNALVFDHLDLMDICMGAFEFEYNSVWPDLINELERWIEANDAMLSEVDPPE
ncbi:hypothetical protein EV667_2998 [Ancylobacter aquaticus]|uniref:Uncharacterized protein n=1 Tax=Ancylobacter aquaticus TaxID=100 RepID=A0A4R1I4M5_ANCAQ|nr:hypothetical protein [Ancylobacter aquaticus]TCK28981.1 hypothetical protein EV667_2998 [Ancylobacter aquaticus]